MRISRVSAGLVMIGISIFLFLLARVADDSEMRVAELAFVQNSLAVIAIVLMACGIYLAAFSKACPVCGERVTRAARECQFCGHIFKTSTRVPHPRAPL
jgi:type III secretory pathway component EscT